MREILFRGQTRKKGEKVRVDGRPVESNWVYGGIFHQNDRGGSFSVIYSYDPVEKHVVYADTVGQFTGVSDKNGAKIFEGDIAVIDGNETGVIEWADDTASFVVRYYKMGDTHLHCYWEHNLQVIGNIIDNPELLRKD